VSGTGLDAEKCHIEQNIKILFSNHLIGKITLSISQGDVIHMKTLLHFTFPEMVSLGRHENILHTSIACLDLISLISLN
jgi:hypothetical protein